MAKRLVDVRSLARSHTENAVNTLHSIMMEPKSPSASRIAAAEILINRGWGKASQPITGANEGPIKVSAIAWLDTIDASDRAKVIEGHSTPGAPNKEIGQKAIPNGNGSHSIWDNRHNIEPNNPSVVPVGDAVGAPSCTNTDAIAIERLPDELPE